MTDALSDRVPDVPTVSADPISVELVPGVTGGEFSGTSTSLPNSRVLGPITTKEEERQGEGPTPEREEGAPPNLRSKQQDVVIPTEDEPQVSGTIPEIRKGVPNELLQKRARRKPKTQSLSKRRLPTCPIREVVIRSDFTSDLIYATAPIPATLVSAHRLEGYMGGFRRQHDLWVPIDATTWSRRCARDPALPWQLWTVLRCNGLDTPQPGMSSTIQPVGTKTVVARLEGVTIRRSGTTHLGEVPLRLDARDADGDCLSPGPTLGERVQDSGLTHARDWIVPEAEHVTRFLEADRALGLTAVLGPLTPWMVNAPLDYRRKAGMLDQRWRMTTAGWWSLAYLAEQGVARKLELARAWHLGFDQTRSPDHLQAVQKLVLRMMAERGYIPLGVEYSAVSLWIAQHLDVRADALMYDPEARELIWIEVLWRKEPRIGKVRMDRYRLVREEVLPYLAQELALPMRLYVETKGGGVEERQYVAEPERRLEDLSPEAQAEAQARVAANVATMRAMIRAAEARDEAKANAEAEASKRSRRWTQIP